MDLTALGPLASTLLRSGATVLGGALPHGRWVLQRYNMPAPAHMLGKWAQGFVDLEFDDSASWRGAMLQVGADKAGFSQTSLDGLPYNPAQDKLPSSGLKITRLTPPFIVPADTTSLHWSLTLDHNETVAGARNIYVGRAGFVEVPDPRQFRGYSS